MIDFLLFLAGLVVGAIGLTVARRVTGFVSQDIEDYADNLPPLDMRKHLSGDMLCEGLIFGPVGSVTSRFKADINVTWDGPSGLMTEHFIYDDGTTQDRAWRLTLGTDGTLRAEADDVIGAGAGVMRGNALALRYKIRLPAQNGGHVLNATDWMYVQEDGVIFNRSQFRKFGIKVAELFCTIRPLPKE